MECLKGCIHSGDFNSTCFDNCYITQGWDPPINHPAHPLPLYASLLLSAVLICFSGLFSGLNLGLLSLDLVGLKILTQAGTAAEKKYAEILIPVRQHGNLLLCTLLLGGTVVNSAISILLSDITSGTVGLVLSTFVILILGEIGPQALCSKHSLRIGAAAIGIVKFFIVVFMPVTWPIAKVLDITLGRDMGQVYSQEELKKLIDIHVEDPEAQKESGLTRTDQRLLRGVFEYKDKQVRDVMTHINNCFMLEKSTKLTFQTMSKVYLSGCSRIPIYENARQQIIGVLYVKDLILVDPDDELEVAAVMTFRGRNVCRVYDDVTLDKVFTKFITTANHLLIAHAPPLGDVSTSANPASQTPVTGLITLEDVLEEVIKSEIYDESDAQEMRRNKGHRQDLSIYFNLFEHKMRGSKLSPQEVAAVTAFLSLNVDEFKVLAGSSFAFKGLLRTATVMEKGSEGGMDQVTTGKEMSRLAVSPDMLDQEGGGDAFWTRAQREQGLLYERGKKSSWFTLILQGRVLIRTGLEAFELEQGPWSQLGNRALIQEEYVADFDAVAVPPYRILRIHRGSFLAAVDALRIDHAREYQEVRHRVKMMATTGATAQVPTNREAMTGLSPTFPVLHQAVNWPSPLPQKMECMPRVVEMALQNADHTSEQKVYRKGLDLHVLDTVSDRILRVKPILDSESDSGLQTLNDGAPLPHHQAGSGTCNKLSLSGIPPAFLGDHGREEGLQEQLDMVQLGSHQIVEDTFTEARPLLAAADMDSGPVTSQRDPSPPPVSPCGPHCRLLHDPTFGPMPDITCNCSPGHLQHSRNVSSASTYSQMDEWHCHHHHDMDPLNVKQGGTRFKNRTEQANQRAGDLDLLLLDPVSGTSPPSQDAATSAAADGTQPPAVFRIPPPPPTRHTPHQRPHVHPLAPLNNERAISQAGKEEHRESGDQLTATGSELSQGHEDDSIPLLGAGKF